MASRGSGGIKTASVSSARPRISAVTVSPSAGVTYVAAVVANAVVEPSVAVTTAVAASSVAYISMVTNARLDTTGLFTLVMDTVTMLDGTRFTLARPLSDSFVLADSHRVEFEKSLVGDSITLSDSLAKTLIFIRSFTDTQGLTDSVRYTMAKAAVDAVAMADTKRISTTKPLADGTTMVDVVTRLTAKALVESVSLADVRTMSIDKLRQDAVTIADAAIRSVQKALADTVTTSENRTYVFSKLIADGFAMNDSFDTGDGLLYSFAKGISNVTIVSDAASRVVTKATADTASLSDSGSLISQSYVDLTYFAEDYVGQRRVF